MSKEVVDISQKLQTTSKHRMAMARRLIYLNMSVYLLMSVGELLIGRFGHATVLIADGKNNITGVLSSVLLLVGLHFSSIPRDDVHQEGHWQYETIAVFLAGIIMDLVGLNCLWSAGQSMIAIIMGQTSAIRIIAAYTAAISGTLMLVISRINHLIGVRTQDSALIASARDSLSDAFTSYGTMIAIFLTYWLRLNWFDSLATLILGIYIIVNGNQIISTSAEKLSNGFNPVMQAHIRHYIGLMPGVRDIDYVNGRYTGDNIIIETEIRVSGKLSTTESFQLCKRIEADVQTQFPILYCCIQVRPFPNSID
ncbi:MAG: cation diffusion facilitator family transporter [Furfurilactobacillus sp.]|jgi:cation diffusion facilitator family transporter|uniref:Cation diffusion facilitator family transporter n=2 Tax=Furfurilactobacillus TaxID=2767882 RepID=A0ABT6DCJ3_9LACO|nr:MULTISPECIES: cation diffusion facilitator family transporter [Furfurilactobacillus]QLE65444.1 Cobalt-zinc-cadmium resistance protein [Furfurilactobacillus rossiae]MCF6160942.1 cation diffusion facilitator family transporter [Furfurilactobacillus milii]MCF6163292.1 cation diffusion facilitator family transporter [Furfurilactobacillus milii]MCH4011951.1 cation diffusion facilitator family transporter [Furfurilactobacillus sp.]MCH4037843.1 cation diffusion facilitator family transporter [Furf